MAPNGYAWWYIDAISDDGQHALTLIAFVGSVFSPYYARARRAGPADPEHHVAINLALYSLSGDSRGLWTMTERGRKQLSRAADHLVVGPSGLRIEGDRMAIDIDEWAAPLPRRVRGWIALDLPVISDSVFHLDAAGRHRWQPLCTHARIEVNFTHPALRWTGDAYFDTNDGDRALEEDFNSWTWSRAALTGRPSTVLYDVTTADCARRLAIGIHRDGHVEEREPLAMQPLANTRWRMRRQIGADSARVQVTHTLEDAPFYARSLVRGSRYGDAVLAVHESLSLTRFSKPWVQGLLPFRMPRWTR